MTRLATLAGLALTGAAFGAPPPRPQAPPEVRIVTTEGSFLVRLDPVRAPLTVRNFLRYVRSGFYRGTLFHRVIPGFVIQGGGYTLEYKLKKARAPIPNESGNGLANVRGTIAMARGTGPHSATSQFYINLADNSQLDPQRDHWGYAVFGQVVAGMNVVDKIAAVPTGPAGPFVGNAPQVPVVIEKIEVLGGGHDP